MTSIKSKIITNVSNIDWDQSSVEMLFFRNVRDGDKANSFLYLVIATGSHYKDTIIFQIKNYFVQNLLYIHIISKLEYSSTQLIIHDEVDNNYTKPRLIISGSTVTAFYIGNYNWSIEKSRPDSKIIERIIELEKKSNVSEEIEYH